MCGFCGFTTNNDYLSYDADKVLFEMMSKIIHRGPNEEGKYVNNDIALGFRRLSILDLEGGSQPIYNENNQLVLLFNGEIYNFMELKNDLEDNGHLFKTNSDSEVVLHGFEEYGIDILNKLRGMFAFVIWDNQQKSLFGARDFFGIKPFYYSLVDGDLIFSSEIKSILEHPFISKILNKNALQRYLTFQYSPLSETFFSGINKIPQGHYFIYKNGEIDIIKYWEFAFNKDYSIKETEEQINELEQVLNDSINIHHVSDVEVGAFLSSGVDSSYIASSFKGKKTFSVGFNHGNYNEVADAIKLSNELGINNFHKIITAEEYWGSLTKIQYYMDEPLADPSAVALYFLSELASKHVKVVLSGEGADELFGGYNIYKEPLSLEPMYLLPNKLRKSLGNLAKLIPYNLKGKNYLIRASKTVEERFIGNAYIFDDNECKDLLKEEYFNNFSVSEITEPFYCKVKEKDDITKMQYLDINMWLTGDILLKADKMSMAHSLEVRVPFLDKEVAKVASNIPLYLRVNNNNTKYLFRLVAKRKLTDYTANKKKLGFPIPIRVWLREEKYYNKVLLAFLSENSQKFFRTEILINLLKEHFTGKRDNSRKIWTIYMFLIWYEVYFNNSTNIQTNDSTHNDEPNIKYAVV